MRPSRPALLVVALVGLALTLGHGLAGVAGQEATPGAGAAATPAACPATTEEQNAAIARAWHDEVINRRNPAALRDILAPTVVHHAAGGYPQLLDEGGITAMMGDFLAAFPDLHYRFDFFVVQGAYVVERYTATGTQEGPLGDLPPSGRFATWTGITSSASSAVGSPRSGPKSTPSAGPASLRAPRRLRPPPRPRPRPPTRDRTSCAPPLSSAMTAAAVLLPG